MKTQLSILLLAITLILVLTIPCLRPLADSRQSNDPLPTVAAAAVPLYPPVAVAARIQGTIHVKVSTDGQRVTSAQAKEDLKPLSNTSEENARTWKFSKHMPMTFTISYLYKLSEECKPNNPTVTLRLPTDVEVCQYPFREY